MTAETVALRNRELSKKPNTQTWKGTEMGKKDEEIMLQMIDKLIDSLTETRTQLKRLQELVKVLEQFEPADHYNNRNRIS